MSLEDLEQLRLSNLRAMRRNLALGLVTLSGGDGTDDEDDEEQDPGADDEDDDEETEGDGDGEDDDSAKQKRRKAARSKTGYQPPASQDELDRIVEDRLKRERKKLNGEAMTAAQEKLKKDAEIERQKKAGNYEPVIKAKDEEIEQLKADQDELEFYRDLFADQLKTASKGLPKNILDKLMPKNLKPHEQLQWLKDYREAAGVDDDSEDDEGDDEDESEDSEAVKARKAAAAAKRKTTTKKVATNRRPAGGGAVPKPEDLLKKHREKHRVGF